MGGSAVFEEERMPLVEPGQRADAEGGEEFGFVEQVSEDGAQSVAGGDGEEADTIPVPPFRSVRSGTSNTSRS